MNTTYQLWDTTNRNLIGEYTTLNEAQAELKRIGTPGLEIVSHHTIPLKDGRNTNP